MSQIYADEVIPPRAADSRGQNKTNAEDAGSDWDFLELNGKAAAERSSTMQGDGSITLKSSRDEAVRRQRAHFRGAPDTPSPTLSQKTEPDTGDRAFREVLARLKEAQQRAAADGAAAGGVFRAMGRAAADYEDVSGQRQRFLARSASHLFCLADRCASGDGRGAARSAASLFELCRALSDGACERHWNERS